MANRLCALQTVSRHVDLGGICVCDLYAGVGLVMQEMIEIRSQAKRNVLVSVLFGVVGLVIASVMFGMLPEKFYVLGMFVTSGSLVAFLIAWVKYREPQYSFLLSKNTIYYRHRHGKWQLNWDNIQRMDVPKISSSAGLQPLEMVAIKIKDYSVFLQNISPRLMSNILMEQRPLLFHNRPADGNCATGMCNSDELLEDDYFKDEHGNEYKGMQAMFANRMAKLRQRLGYDIFVASAELDRSAQEFSALLKQCQQQVLMPSSSG